MTERLKSIGKQLLNLWNKYTAKQKTLIVSVVCVVIVALAILIFLMSRVDYRQLKVCDTPKEASEIATLLSENNIKYDIDTNTNAVRVDNKDYNDAFILLNMNDISTEDVSIDDLLGNSLSTTNADRVLKVNLYFQSKLRNDLKKFEGIDDAKVYYIPRDSADELFASEATDTSASVLLTVNDDFKAATAQTIAEIVASIIGNQSADKIRVSDQYGNLLYGGSEDLYNSSFNSKEEYKEKLTNNIVNRLVGLLIKTGYADATVGPNFSYDMNKVSELLTEYSAPEGMEQGLYSHSYTYETESSGSSGGTPGTSSNDGVTYETEDSSSSNSTSNTEEYDYTPNEKVTNTEYEMGAFQADQSSVSIVLTKVTSYTEKELKDSGVLAGTTFDAYVKANSDLVEATVDQSIYTLVSTATGIAEDKITIKAFDKSVFVPTTTTAKSWTDYLQIALAVLIVGLLVFVVFKGVKPVEVTELEPELSVEQLLATTKENQSIEDIEFNEVSEVRRMIEKFVDEKPEAVAQLLRNWLNEDWS
jgi:flagellar M-ring protein FliF